MESSRRRLVITYLLIVRSSNLQRCNKPMYRKIESERALLT